MLKTTTFTLLGGSHIISRAASPASLVMDAAGNLYGTTSLGGTGAGCNGGGCGVVFEIMP